MIRRCSVIRWRGRAGVTTHRRHGAVTVAAPLIIPAAVDWPAPGAGHDTVGSSQEGGSNGCPRTRPA
ncbi:hypothetical protein BKA56DRAFT_604020 [Ilyonectria sp. MPI-CAGE-AT-0026]|nr:hypothetical protein BKA56DRAFT_604020 [Ilyonectria sp. MPI-CAGE-AT-0026]